MKNTYTLLVALCAVFLSSTHSGHAVYEDGSLDIGAFVASAEGLTGQPVKVRGFVVEVCLHRGCKLFVRDLREGSGSTLRVERTDATSPFSGEIKGDEVVIAGVARTTRIDAAYLDAWEAEVRGSGKAKTPGELGGCGDAEACEEEDEAAVAARNATLQQIADYRERAARDKRGYLLSVWIECTAIDVQS
jgi:hypothetical protein